MNWRAKPLVSYRVIVDLISATTTKTGLTIHCAVGNRSSCASMSKRGSVKLNSSRSRPDLVLDDGRRSK